MWRQLENGLDIPVCESSFHDKSIFSFSKFSSFIIMFVVIGLLVIFLVGSVLFLGFGVLF